MYTSNTVFLPWLWHHALKGRNIKYYQMKLKPNSYLLEAELIKYSTKFKMEEQTKFFL